MKKFIINLFSNRFGIILAALNVCYLASRGELLMHAPFGKYFAAANSPALCSTLVSLEFVAVFTGRLAYATEFLLGNTLIVFFITLQWLFIGWLSYTLAGKLRQTAWWKNHDIRW